MRGGSGDKKTDRVALVTGGATGIGRACVQALHAQGLAVVVGDLDIPAAHIVADSLGPGGRGESVGIDDETNFFASVDRLDVLINNAGQVAPSKAVQDTTLAEFDRLIDVNLRGCYLGCKLAFDSLKATRGCVVNISSMAGVTGQERHAIYAATKGAINTLTKCCAIDWGPLGIRCNAVCPIGVWTDTLRRWCDEQPDKASINTYLNQIHALGYCPGPGEIASVVAFLCSDAAKFITGAILPVSGGGECGYRVHAPAPIDH
jgi:meso-butanediol dehydrogenase / (S,S)-butanediol dehydrogenase / diacetyl reductase